MLALLSTQPVVISMLVLFVPGIALVRWPDKILSTPPFAARAILWSLTILTFLSLLLSYLHLPPFLSILIAIASSLFVFYKQRASITRKCFRSFLSFSLLFLLVFTAFSLPFLLFHDGLPTGDSQKSIYWANYIIDNQSLPDYSLSIDLLNRDPVDFYTPGLHALTAAIMQAIASPDDSALPIMTIGFFSISLAVAVSVIAIAIGFILLDQPPKPLFLGLIPLLILTNFRFLRYLREPGYHYQNILGELLFFGLLFLILSLLKKWRSSDFILAVFVALTLLLTHQFSTFLAALTLLPPTVLLFFHYKKNITGYLASHRYALTLLILLAIFVLSSFIFIGLHRKIPHIFTANPHLIASTPSLMDYPVTMGIAWSVFGLTGLVMLTIASFKNRTNLLPLAFSSTAIALLALSQGPRLYIDIPPVRALLYAVVPLSIFAAFFLIAVKQQISTLGRPARSLALSLLLLTILIPVYSSTAKAYQLSHKVRTNSSLLAEHLPIISYLKHLPTSSAAVLIDDYNRRSSSWFLLSGQPTFSRLSSNIKIMMDEARQSELRRRLYLKQLDFEKIYMLGSYPQIADLLAKHNIRYLTGIDGSSYNAFSHNPILQEVTKGHDLTLFKIKTPADNRRSSGNGPSLLPADSASWLLRPATLVNDIGDLEDTYKHLPVSLLATRLSPPLQAGQLTYRSTTAPFIPISFNVSGYVSELWDQDRSGHADSSLQLIVRTLNNQPLDVMISDTLTVSVTGDYSPVTIPANHVNLGEEALLTFTILNPDQQLINIDLIALGLSRVP